ncbi:MAG: DUF1329 domain-containing protein, partial [Panacagrimonas sp.]
LLLVFALSPLALADQYRSEVREVAPPPKQTAPQNPAELLKSTTDPYARALLLRDLAVLAAQKKDYKEAARLLNEALKLNALSGPAAEMMKKDLTALLLATGSVRDQVPQLEALIRSGSGSPEMFVALGAAYVENKRYKEAVPLLQKGLAASPNPDSSWRRALIAALMGAGQHAEAAKQLEALLKADAAQPEAWLQLSALYLKSGNKERSQATMEIAGRLGYLDTAAQRLQLVILTGQIGAPFEAASVLQGWMAAGRMPNQLANQKLLAALWVRARESRLALAALEQVAKQQPSAELYQHMAQLHLERQDYEQAAQALQQSIAIGGKQGPALLSLGLARYQLADVDAARAAFVEAVKFPAQKKLGEDWLKYLASGQARELAMTEAMRLERQKSEALVDLSGRLLDAPVVNVDATAGPVRSAAGSGELTPVGAERDGNADGSIPPWTGGLNASQWPPAFKRGQRLVDPYPSDRPLYTITAANLGPYRDRLSRGHQALLEKFPSYQIPVYATRRGVAYPQAIYDATQANIGRARLAGSDALKEARLGFPFPKPESGVEVMWNHRVRYRGNTVEAQSQQVVVGADGKAGLPVRLNERVYFRYGNTADPADLSSSNILLYYFMRFTGTALNSFIALVYETADSVKDGRDIWVSPKGLPKLLRIPPVGYDNPFPGTEGMYFIDMIDMYNGAFDRYVWKLVGKRELILPYNGYRISSGQFRYAQLLTPKHFNPAATRYEAHRVWVVEASERGGSRHSFGQRVFYVDEDSWNVVLVENYDREGRLWRFQEGHLLPSYDSLTANCFPVVTYDLKDGRYFANRLIAEEPAPKFDVPMRPGEFLPATITAKEIR